MKLFNDLKRVLKSPAKPAHFRYGAKAWASVLTQEGFSALIKSSRFMIDDMHLKWSEPQHFQSLAVEGTINPMMNRNRMSNRKLQEAIATNECGIRIFSVYDFDERIDEFRLSVARKVRCDVSTNLYFSPKGSDNFLPPHRDDYGILILQISGKKKFSIEGSKDVTLGAGDALYIPRNFLHSAVPLGAHSLHLTFGLHERKYDQFFQFMLSQADEDFGEALPLGRDKKAMAKLVAEKSRRIAQYLVKSANSPAMVESFFDKFEAEMRTAKMK